MRKVAVLRSLSSLLAVVPAFALAQGQVARDAAAPGAAQNAWPLGLIVAMVAIFAIAAMIGVLAMNRYRRGMGGPPTHP